MRERVGVLIVGDSSAAGVGVRTQDQALAGHLRTAHDLCNEHRDIATASLIEVWIDETERRTWFLFEASRKGESGH